MNTVLTPESEYIEAARERALERGRKFVEDFKTWSEEEQIDYLASEIFYDTYRYLYEGWGLSWEDLPITSETRGQPTKSCYLYAATHALKIMKWMQP